MFAKKINRILLALMLTGLYACSELGDPALDDSSSDSSQEGVVLSSSSPILSSSSSTDGSNVSSSEKSSSSQGVPFNAATCINTVGNDKLTDCRDGQVYKQVKIGTQTWLAQNINYAGDDGLGGPAYSLGVCQGTGDPSPTESCATYGRFYTWDEALRIDDKYLQLAAGTLIKENHQGVCPNGWHVSTRMDWEILSLQIRSDKGVSAGSESMYIKSPVIGIYYWNDVDYNLGTDPYGFTIMPGGWRYAEGNWTQAGSDAYFRLANENSATGAGYVTIMGGSSKIDLAYIDKKIAMNVRCVQN